MRTMIALAAFVFTLGCASANDSGWTGSGAQPFGAAEAECQTETQAERGPAFDACMADKGWTHPQH